MNAGKRQGRLGFWWLVCSGGWVPPPSSSCGTERVPPRQGCVGGVFQVVPQGGVPRQTAGGHCVVVVFLVRWEVLFLVGGRIRCSIALFLMWLWLFRIVGWTAPFRGFLILFHPIGNQEEGKDFDALNETKGRRRHGSGMDNI